MLYLEVAAATFSGLLREGCRKAKIILKPELEITT
jgi:hypothetical protein